MDSVTLMILVAASMTPLVLGCGAVLAESRRKSAIAAWSIVMTLGLPPLSMIFNLWPPRLALLISQPSMNRPADRVASGEVMTAPEWAGLYEIVAAEVDPQNGNVALIIDNAPAGRSGFVRLIDPSVSDGPMLNLNYNEPVGGRWRYQNED